MPRIPLHHILEEMFGIGQISTKGDIELLIKELRAMPDFEIDFGKYAKGADKADKRERKPKVT